MLGKNRILVIAVIGVVVIATTTAFLFRDGNDVNPSIDSDSNQKTTNSVATSPTVTGTNFTTPESVIAPTTDQWPSEAFTANATSILKKFKVPGSKVNPSKLSSTYFADGFRLRIPRAKPEVIYDRGGIVATRLPPSENEGDTISREGVEAVSGFLEELAVGTREIRLLKIIGVEMKPDVVSTKVRCESVVEDRDKNFQSIQTWEIDWQLPSGQSPLFESATLVAEQTAERVGGQTFADRTLDVLGQSDAYARQLRFGLQHWLARIETAHGMNYFSKHGLAVADVNGDGRDDVFVCQPAGLPNRLFLQSENGQAIEVSQRYGLDLLDRTSAALFVDLDNDGDQDVALATLTGLKIYEQAGPERFLLRVEKKLADTDLHGISAVDFDNDGDLDLYQIVDYASDVSRSRAGLPSFVYHNANDGGSNRLFRNDIRSDEWSFQDVTESVGLSENNQRHSLAAAWNDYDNDGDQDLYVANDYGQNCLYRNDGGTFTEVASIVGVTDFGSGMSVTWGDYDRDQKSDLYVSNMFSSAGNRITNQSQFLPKLSTDRKRLYSRFAKGNSLFRSVGNGAFLDTGGELDVEVARWAWGSLFADFNNDGWEDLLVANGYITTNDTGDL